MNSCLKCLQLIEPTDSKYGLHTECFITLFNLDNSLAEFEDLALKREKQNSQLSVIHTSFFQGAFKKYSAKLGSKSYILKVQDDDYPELPSIEYLSNQIGQQIGLIVPNFYLVRFPNEINAKFAFVVHNFMENYIPGNLVHIYHFVVDKPFSCKTIYRVIEEKIGRMDALKQFIFLCLFDALIGNHDRHGRNIALIETKKGYRLAPFYDNPSYMGIEEQSLLLARHNPRGKIITSKNDEPTMHDYVVEFVEMGHSSWVKEFLGRVNIHNIYQLIENSFITDKRKKAVTTLIKQRLNELENAIF